MGHSWGDGSCDGLRWGLTSTAEPQRASTFASRASETVTAALTQLSLGLLRKEVGKKVKPGREGQSLTTLMCLTIGPSGDQHSHWPIPLSMAHCIIV